MRAHDRLAAVSGDEPIERSHGESILARVGVARRLADVEEEHEAVAEGGLGQHLGGGALVQAIALAVGAQLAQATRPCPGAALHFTEGIVAGPRLDGAEGDEPSAALCRRLQ